MKLAFRICVQISEDGDGSRIFLWPVCAYIYIYIYKNTRWQILEENIIYFNMLHFLRSCCLIWISINLPIEVCASNFASKYRQVPFNALCVTSLKTVKFFRIFVQMIISYLLKIHFNPLNAQLNPICHLLALLGAHHIFHVGGLRVNILFT